jgi:hypothetical protein
LPIAINVRSGRFVHETQGMNAVPRDIDETDLGAIDSVGDIDEPDLQTFHVSGAVEQAGPLAPVYLARDIE